MKVKELIEKLQKLDPELEIIQYQSDMERSGYQKVNLYPKVDTMKIETRRTWDRFDGTDYSYDVFVPAEKGEDGQKVVVII